MPSSVIKQYPQEQMFTLELGRVKYVKKPIAWPLSSIDDGATDMKVSKILYDILFELLPPSIYTYSQRWIPFFHK